MRLLHTGANLLRHSDDRRIANGWPSFVSEDLVGAPTLTRDEIRERMSGNLCRCGAYANIVAAIC